MKKQQYQESFYLYVCAFVFMECLETPHRLNPLTWSFGWSGGWSTYWPTNGWSIPQLFWFLTTHLFTADQRLSVADIFVWYVNPADLLSSTSVKLVKKIINLSSDFNDLKSFLQSFTSYKLISVTKLTVDRQCDSTNNVSEIEDVQIRWIIMRDLWG